ncbi:MAG: hypothetical protein RL610_153 [Pseudomonadota bacterium]
MMPRERESMTTKQFTSYPKSGNSFSHFHALALDP